VLHQTGQKVLISQTFFPAYVLASTEETKPNSTKANIHPQHENTTIHNKHKKTKAMFSRLVRPPVCKWSRTYYI